VSEAASSGATPQYVVARVRDALAHDERVAALDINVRIVGNGVYVTGAVTTAARRQAVEDVVTELLPAHVVHNQLSVLEQDAPHDVEEVT
jgi:osmotically-inducible protein OsmY